ncbi:VWA domain-containing protein [Brevibacillus invocatus]|uniref:VWA domain-containing protein n=1 Tax=Brevibacillus invocatus TaxID=173959 RepID=A0A3M8C6I2_9BACL|nr:VWA domain-containing protein [Brevibacillus invocatus]RNB71161.1 VWA domain-containing protein [Brevibacillus invocatus]
MGINFLQPLFLLLLIPAVYVVVRWWQGQKQMATSKKMTIAIIRMMVFALLILVLSGLQLLFPVQGKTIVFVADRSASMKDDPRIISFMREAVQNKRADDQYAVVVVGATAAVDQPLTLRAEVQQLGVEINKHATDLAEGIRLAAALIPSQARGKVVLLTDGVATHGDAGRETQLVKERGIEVEVVSLQQPQGNEVVLTSLQVPQQLYAGEEYAISVEVESTIATQATLRLYEGNREAGSQRVQVEKGKNRYVFSQKATEQGFHRYRVEIEAQRDTSHANNQATAYTQVAGTPSVMIVEGHPGAASNLVSALKAGNIEVEVKELAMLPKELDAYKQYASLILADVSATQLGETDMERMRTAVRDLGMGLIMTGGADSFGMGGWFQTPIEEALPVHMDLRGKEELPSLGLQLVIDKSGSMTGDATGYDKMELAKEAAIRATSMLNAQDQIGVIAFDGTPWEVVSPQPVTNLSAIHQQIGSIQADGGTDIFPALQMAYDRIKSMQSQRKHIILLTDGQSGSNDAYDALLQQLTAENITVSTVALGADADTQLLEMIAQGGKGRYYFANDAASIPQIFSKETALASRTFIVEKPQVPARTGAGQWSSLRQELPALRAYVATTPKQTAEVSLISQDDDPLLARWQYGLGRTIAWTSDLEGKWAPDWVSWGAGSRFWNEIVAWTLPQVNEGTWKTQTELVGGNGKVTVSVPSGAAMPQELEGIVLNQQMERTVIRLKPTAPGTLEGEFAASEPGSYLIQIVEKGGGQVTASQTTGLTVSYSPEYGLTEDGEHVAKSWLMAGGGSFITTPDEVFGKELPEKWETQLVAEWLLILAALLWPLDVAVRRLQLPDQWWSRLGGLWKGRKVQRSSNTPQQEQDAVWTRLEEKRAKRRTQAQPNVDEPPKMNVGQPVKPPTESGRKVAAQQAEQTEAVLGHKEQNNADQAEGKQDETFNRLLAAKKRRNK